MNNKGLSVLSIGFAFAGSILGAGYLSGQEIFQFFGAFGWWGIGGLGITLILLASLSFVAMRFASHTGITALDRVLIPWEIPALRFLAAFIEMFFFIATVIVMFAGGGALLNDLFDIPIPVSSLIMCISVSFVALSGIGGTIKAFSILVPITAVITVIFSIASVCVFGMPEIPYSSGNNPLIGNWFVSAITFTSYNFFSAIGILAPMGAMIKKKGKITAGSLAGAIMLMLIALSVLIAMFSLPESCDKSLPMLEVARRLNPALCYPYGVILLFGMFGTSLFSLVAVLTFFEAKKPSVSKYNWLFILINAVVCYPLSLFGFGNLISVLYPVTGYISIIFIACMIWHYITKVCKRK